MYGYVRPVRDELKVREYEQFHGAYCGLCHTLKKRYGPLARFAVNYDLTFLAMLLAGGGEGAHTCSRRCPYHPLRRTACPEAWPGMDAAADLSIILAWGKLTDSVQDGGVFEKLGAGLLRLLMRPAYRKAALRRPGFALTAADKLRELTVLEKERSASLDAVCDTFACILREAAEGAGDETRVRILRELLYHLGRIVYVLDAADDLRDDVRSGAYNPLIYRFSPKDGALSAEEEEELRLSLTHSHNSVCAAYALLEENVWKGILDNIIYLGLPAVTHAVFTGEWRRARQRKRGRNRL